MPFVVRIVGNDGNLGLGQLNIIQLACGEHGERNVEVLDHLDGDGIEQFYFGVVVQRVLGQDFFTVLYKIGHGVGTVVPQRGVVCTEVAVYANFRDQLSAERSQAVIGGHGGEVSQRSQTGDGENTGVVIGCYAYHLGERTGDGIERLGSVFALGLCQLLGILVILLSALDHLDRHRSVGGLVLCIVQNPFQADHEVFCYHIGFVVALVINPLYVITQGEDPGDAIIRGAPFFCYSRQ